MIKVLIADDQELMRQSLQIILSSHADIEVVGVVKDGESVIRSIPHSKPDIILMDIRMPKMDGVQCTKIVKEKYPDIKIIILTMFDDDEYVYDALKYGASGYLLKGISMESLKEAIITVYSGSAMINPDITKKMLSFFSQMAKQRDIISVPVEQVRQLNSAERKVINALSYGYSNKEIADIVNLSMGTVRNYISSILEKLGLRDRTQIAIWAIQSKNNFFEEEDDDT